MPDTNIGGQQLMQKLVSDLPDQLAASAELDGLDSVTPQPDAPGRIVVCGMGGSAIAADLLRPMLARRGVDLRVRRDYGLPGWVDESTLVVASSYSGNTEETLSGARAAHKRGCRVLAVTSGGELEALCRPRGEAIVHLPPGLPPRASLGYGLGALMHSLERMQLLVDVQDEIDAAVEQLRAGREPGSETGALAAGLAADAKDRFVVVYTTSDESRAAGVRLKAQLNENSKVPASVAAFPELNHNDIVGWESAPGGRENYLLLVLRGGDEHPRVSRRVEISLDVLAAEFAVVRQVRANGRRALARTMSLVQTADRMSCDLAELRGIDPMPVSRIDHLKKSLEEGTNR